MAYRDGRKADAHTGPIRDQVGQPACARVRDRIKERKKGVSVGKDTGQEKRKKNGEQPGESKFPGCSPFLLGIGSRSKMAAIGWYRGTIHDDKDWSSRRRS